MSAACVVDIGASQCSVACVDEGMVLPDSRCGRRSTSAALLMFFVRFSHRINLAYGGDDVTTFLLQNLLRVDFPCQDVDLTRSHDWQMIETLKESICTLQEVRGMLRMLLELPQLHLHRPT
jgi:actin-related protein 8